MTRFFVTGATGAVGSEVVARLLREGFEVVALIRASSREKFEQRSAELESYWLTSGVTERELGRFQGVWGDLGANRFGMELDDYNALAGNVTHVIHAAATVSTGLPIQQAREEICVPTVNILAFADLAWRQGQLEKLDYVSTIGVAGATRGRVPERRGLNPKRFHNTYERAKWEAECAVFAHTDGVPTTVHRPSMVVGDAKTGRVRRTQVFYHLSVFVAGLMTGGFVPKLRGLPIDVVPSDFVSAALVGSALDQSYSGRVLHLCAGSEKYLDADTLAAHVRESIARHDVDLPPLRQLPASVLQALVSSMRMAPQELIRRRAAAVDMFLTYARDRQTFGADKTQHLLASKNIYCPAARDILGPQIAQVEETFLAKRVQSKRRMM
ncbi:hypothetical protein CKO28_23240 [Rhodovibrio sodomensis]|uniref:Thioester reductase (TE) domain-containing protein n=1 Tax=Rhodovibrio sodomensis TaxID=1088 RepID=A0ABS1DLN6_9PROT|nr:SDR family oxidoreductase [Rhodovibrio sodomensis]MBK1670931.1 hypothetical protein [Rhodovibrio sodomensis]